MNTAAAYPLNIEPSVPAKWDHLYFSICINGDEKRNQLIRKAIEEWKTTWMHFEYIIYENKTTCNINIHVTKYPVGLNHERSSEGTTKLSYNEDTGTIYRADIFMFSHVKKYVEKESYCCVELLNEIPDRKFYFITMHEFGHALNLGHPKQDDGLLPMDVMSAAGDADEVVISAKAIATLDSIYDKSSNATDHAVIFGADSIEVSMDTKKLYYASDMVHLSGKVAEKDKVGQFTILKIDESVKDVLAYPSIRASFFTLCSKQCGIFAINEDDGNFSIDLQLNHVGLQLLLIKYGDTTKYFVLEVAKPLSA
jgi:predicted Zn-dependent protease